jgi:hypothetical protein
MKEKMEAELKRLQDDLTKQNQIISDLQMQIENAVTMQKYMVGSITTLKKILAEEPAKAA